MEFQCRLCGGIKDPIDLTYKLGDISAKLIECCQWQWRESAIEAKLPQNVCQSCYDRLDQSWQFSQIVKNVQDLLEKQAIEPCSAFTTDIAANPMGNETKKPPHPVTLETIPENPELILIKSEVDSLHANEPLEQVSGEFISCDNNNDFLVESEHSDNDDFQPKYASSANKSNASNSEIDESDDKAELSTLLATFTRDEYLALIPIAARLDNGEVDSRLITELQLGDWSIFKYKCWICSVLFDDEVAMQEHLNEIHPNRPQNWKCSLCPKVIEPPKIGTSPSFLRQHVIQKHYPYLTFWYVYHGLLLDFIQF